MDTAKGEIKKEELTVFYEKYSSKNNCNDKLRNLI